MTIAASVVPPTMNGLRSASRSDARPTTISTARSNTQNADMIAVRFGRAHPETVHQHRRPVHRQGQVEHEPQADADRVRPDPAVGEQITRPGSVLPVREVVRRSAGELQPHAQLGREVGDVQCDHDRHDKRDGAHDDELRPPGTGEDRQCPGGQAGGKQARSTGPQVQNPNACARPVRGEKSRTSGAVPAIAMPSTNASMTRASSRSCGPVTSVMARQHPAVSSINGTNSLTRPRDR